MVMLRSSEFSAIILGLRLKLFAVSWSKPQTLKYDNSWQQFVDGWTYCSLQLHDFEHSCIAVQFDWSPSQSTMHVHLSLHVIAGVVVAIVVEDEAETHLKIFSHKIFE